MPISCSLAVRAVGLGKRYLLGEAQPGIKTFRETVVDVCRAPLRGLARGRTAARPSMWALRNVSFEVARGEVVGIIGRNGAGKSTLLKLLSRITEPTEGYADVYGRVGSLLEVGTGFHSELSGRENIYLSGAILGMRKSEIEDRFDEIVAFAEVEPFLDTPVKHYSSGMYLRLAFAVAAHMDPEILIVDEVLAVGDVQFQKKCLGKMQDVSRGQGRTVLFVSHNMDAIQRLCSRCLLLDEGSLLADGDCASVIGRYLSTGTGAVRPGTWIDTSRANRSGTGEARVVAVRYTSGDQRTGGHALSGGPLDVSLAIVSDSDRTIGSVAVTLYSLSGTKLVNADSLALGQVIAVRKGDNVVKLRIEELHLNPGIYRVGLWLADPIRAEKSTAVYDHAESAFELEVVSAMEETRLGATATSAVPCRFEYLQTA